MTCYTAAVPEELRARLFEQANAPLEREPGSGPWNIRPLRRRISNADLRPGVLQLVHDLREPELGGPVQRRFPIVVRCVYLGACLEECANDLDGWRFGRQCEGQRRESTAI